MNMKKYFLLILLVINLFFISTNTFAFSDVETHPKITENAAEQSIFGCTGCYYLKDKLGFKKGLDEVVESEITIRTLLMSGAQTEDSGTLPSSGICFRGLDHFYDPLTQKGLEL